jgi:DNA mismatch repair protein MutS
MAFQSILWGKAGLGIQREPLEAPAFFVDLNLDQIVEAVTADRQAYRLQPFYYAFLQDIDLIIYRQEIARDLEDERLLKQIRSFSQKMTQVRRYLSLVEQLDFHYHKAGWFLESVAVYCQAVGCLAAELSRAEVKARGLIDFKEYLSAYTASERFQGLQKETEEMKAALATVTYCILIKGDVVKVRRYESEADYSKEVEGIFEKFKQGAVKDYIPHLPGAGGMNHVEANILKFVAKLYPEIFSGLDRYYENNRSFWDDKIILFDREIQFYVAYLEYIEKFKRAGLKFCYPEISSKEKEVYVREGFHLALADKCLREKTPIVCNDFYLKGKERILVVTGPNQGGKTTFARTFGQLHYWACLGLPVPGKAARLFLYDRIFTHFEKEESIIDLRGKLEDDLIRIRDILRQATPRSLLILNEIFTSTTLKDAVYLSKKIMERIVALDALCVWVTFIDELASFSEKTVSMVSTVDPDNPAWRTFRIERRPADGLAYALSIAEKHRLTYPQLLERIPS